MRSRISRNRLSSRSSDAGITSELLAVETLEARQLLTVSVSNVHLSTDSGVSASDGITSNASVTGNISGSPPAGGAASIQFDHNGDGTVDGTATISGSAFTYDPVAHDTALANYEGSLTLRYRVAEFSGYGNPVSYGDWHNFGFTLDRVAPQAPGFASITVDQGTQTSTINLGAGFNDGVTADSNLSYQIVGNSNGSIFNSLGISQGSLVLNYKTSTYGSADLVVRAIDQAGNSKDATLHVCVAHVNQAPIISSFVATEGFQGTWTLTGTVWDDAGAAGLWVYISGALENYDLWAEVAEDGSFSATVELTDNALNGFATAVTWDGEEMSSNVAACAIS